MVFSYSIVIASNSTGSDIHMLADGGITEIAEVVHICFCTYV